MSEWTQPKTNWNTSDRFNISDFNRIKNNLVFVHTWLSDLVGNFSIIDMGEDITNYDGYWEVAKFNAFETNLETLNKYALNRNYGTTKTFYENGLFINAEELNRIESAILDLYGICKGMESGRRRLPFRIGAFKFRF